MKKNYRYTVTAVPANARVSLSDYAAHFPDIVGRFNAHKVRNQKRIESMELLPQNAVAFVFWTEKPLRAGRELQSLRRVSEALAGYDPAIVTGKSRVLVSA